MIAAIAAIAAAAAVCVVAVAFAIYAALRDLIGPAWAAAAVAGIVALLAVIVALVAFRKAAPKAPRRGEEPPPSLIAKAFDFGRERPVVAAGIATAGLAAAVTVALKNPKVLTAIIAGFLAPPPPRR